MNITFSNIINMNGYGIYIWPAYGLTLLVFTINLIKTFREKRKIKKIILQYLQSIQS